MAKNTSVYLKIGEAKDLPAKDVTGSSDPYCIVKVDNETVARTPTVWRDLNPFWGLEYYLYLPSSFHWLSLHIYDHDALSEDDIIGVVSFDKDHLLALPKGQEDWFPIHKPTKTRQVHGEIHLKFSYQQENDSFQCQIIEARDLALEDKDTSTGLQVTVNCGNNQENTQVVKKTHFPRWNEQFLFEFKDKVNETGQPKIAHFAIYVKKRQNREFIGHVVVQIEDLLPNHTYDRWLRLKPEKQSNGLDSHDSNSNGLDKKLGFLRVRIRCLEERILPSQHYKPLIHLLVESLKESNLDGTEIAGCTVINILDEICLLDKTELATTFVKLFAGQGMILKFLDVVIMQDIQNAIDISSDPNCLFRSNSLATKSVDQFMKIVGMPYLHETLKPIIDKIIEEKKFPELDPNKLSSHRLKGMKGKTNEQILERNTATLTSYLVSIINCILMSADRCPPLMRLVFKHLREKVEEKFPESEFGRDVKYVSVSGFIFLRFFVPATLSPKLFDMHDRHTNEQTSRTLTLIAKAMQNIGNLSLTTKEEWMKPLYPFINDSFSRIREFIDTLIDVDESEANEPGNIEHRSMFAHLTTIKEGFLQKRKAEKLGSTIPFTLMKKRYFWLTNEFLSYSKHPHDQVRSNINIQRICIVERLEEKAFHKSNMFQILYRNQAGTILTLYMQAKDINEMHQWMSAVRKICVNNTDMLETFHPGTFRGHWTCCDQTEKTIPGCSRAHSAVTLGDWRDPLDPDAEAQTIYSQLVMGRDVLKQKYTESSNLRNAAEEEATGAKEVKLECKEKVFQRKAKIPIKGSHGKLKKTASYYETRVQASGELMDVINDIEQVHRDYEMKEKGSAWQYVT